MVPAMKERISQRGSNYWLGRLSSEHPSLHARVVSGQINSVRAACIQAGLIKQMSPMDILRREWLKASTDEQEEFLAWVKESSMDRERKDQLVGLGGFLNKRSIARIKFLIATRGQNQADIMEFMGYKRLDRRLGLALKGTWPPTRDFLEKLQEWIDLED